MLNSLRNAAGTWVAAVFIGLLVISFAVWGIEDLLRPQVDTSVVKLGNVEISQDQYRSLVQERTSQTSRQLGRQLNFREAQVLGIEGQVLSELLVDLTLSEDARRLGLSITDEALGQLIISDPAFAGPNGQFSRATYDNLIRARYGSEPRYLAERKGDVYRAQIYDALTTGAQVSEFQFSLLNRFENERRNIQFITLTQADAEAVNAPTDAELQSYFDGLQARYRAPEMRKITLLTADEDIAKARIEVSDEDVAKYYQNNKAAFANPEKRTVLQIKLQDKAEAEAIAARIAAGESFEAIATERGLSEADYSLGSVTRGDILDATEAEAAFTLEAGATSNVVESRFGFAIIKVASIEPSVETPVQDAKAQIIDEIRTSQAKVEMLDVFDEVEDLRAGGATFAEIAEKLSLTLQGFETSAAGQTLDETQLNIPSSARVLDMAFAADPSDELDPIDTRTGFLWVHVDEVIAERARTLDEVKAKVTTDWTNEQQRLKLNQASRAVLDRLQAGESLITVSADTGKTLQGAEGIGRTTQSLAVSDAAVEVIFNMPEDGYADALGLEENTRIVFQVTDVTFDPNAIAETAKDSLNQRLAEDLMLQYVGERQEEMGLKLNDDNRLRALGQLPQQQP